MCKGSPNFRLQQEVLHPGYLTNLKKKINLERKGNTIKQIPY